MNWHARYTQQASWTRELRAHLFHRTGMQTAGRVMEVGCGTGAVLREIQTHALHGLDLQPASLIEARVHAPVSRLTCGDALHLPFADRSFEIVFCHFLLLWVTDPRKAIEEMKRITVEGGHVLALAEPDYGARVDKPAELVALGDWQAESLIRQGADPFLGGRLADLFYQAGIELVETGAIEPQGREAFTTVDWELEWAVMENDLAGFVSDDEIRRLRSIDAQARLRGVRSLHIPTYFAWGRA